MQSIAVGRERRSVRLGAVAESRGAASRGARPPAGSPEREVPGGSLKSHLLPRAESCCSPCMA